MKTSTWIIICVAVVIAGVAGYMWYSSSKKTTDSKTTA